MQLRHSLQQRCWRRCHVAMPQRSIGSSPLHRRKQPTSCIASCRRAHWPYFYGAPLVFKSQGHTTLIAGSAVKSLSMACKA